MPVFQRKNLLLLILLSCTAFSVSAQTAFSLKECIAYGLAHHPSIAVSKNNIENAHQAAREAIADYLPQVNANISATNNLKLQTTIIPAGAFSPAEQRISFGNKYTTSLVADATQPI